VMRMQLLISIIVIRITKKNLWSLWW
jgi:hypothetical protein